MRLYTQKVYRKPLQPLMKHETSNKPTDQLSHLLKILEKRERGHIQGLSKFFGYPLLSEERIKLRTSNFVGTFRGSIRTKARENVGNSSRGRSQGVAKIFRAPMYMAHCAVIFAIAQLSCFISASACKNDNRSNGPRILFFSA